MTIPIDGTAGLPLFEVPGPSEAGTAPPALGDVASFEGVFGRALAAHSAKAHETAALAESFAAGKTEDIHGTMIAIKEVEIELRVISNVRRKVVDAFQELWRMNI
jgi:flagellar hook-basal body complex protein FliE